MKIEFGVIGGSGFEDVVRGKEVRVKTEFGNVEVLIGEVEGKKIVFMNRHGKGHLIAPHKINYKANLSAFKKLGVRKVIATAACGVIQKFKPGEFIIVRDFIGFHLGPLTVFEKFNVAKHHVDFSEPYSPELCRRIKRAAEKHGIKLKDGGIVAGVFGPRFETKAEIRALKKMGANLVSMTNAFEAIVARELGLEYAAIAVGTNWAAGITNKPLSYAEVKERMKREEAALRKLVFSSV